MIMPAFPGAPPATMKAILVVAGATELILLIALFILKTPRENVDRNEQA